MSKELIRAVKFRGYWLAVIQIIIILLASFVALIAAGCKASYSMLLGGLISFIPNLFFARKLFQNVFARDVRTIMKVFYRNEVIKLVLMGCLFVILLKLKITIELFLVLGFVIAQIGVLLLPVIYMAFEKDF